MALAPQNTAPEWVASSVTSDMMGYLLSKAPAINNFNLDASTGGVITHDSIDINIPPAAFRDVAGNPVSGNVILKLQTVSSTSDMIYTGVTGVSQKGELLISAGMFRLEVYNTAGDKLKLAKGTTISAVFPKYDASNIAFKGFERGETNNKVLWNTWDSTAVQKFGDNSLVTGIDSVFKFGGLGRLMDKG